MNCQKVLGVLLTYCATASMGTTAVGATAIWGTSPVAEPYPYVSTGSFSGPAVPASPDPLVQQFVNGISSANNCHLEEVAGLT